MATKKAAAEDLVEKNQSEALATINFQEDAGAGVEGADKDSYAIPFLIMLQPGSPVVQDVDDNGKPRIEGARAGVIMNTVSSRISKEVDLVFTAFSRRFVAWEPRESGGGYKGAILASEFEQKVADGLIKPVTNDKGKIQFINKEGHIYRDTRQHYVLVREDGAWTRAMIAMASTQIKRSKKLMTVISTFQMPGKAGLKFNPPSFARYFTARSEKEEKNGNTWFSWLINPVGIVEDPSVYHMAKDFNKAMSEGKIKVDYSQAKDDGDTGGGEDTSGKF